MSTDAIAVDYALAMSDGIGPRGGLTDEELDAEAPAFERALRRVRDEASSGVLGFWGLPRDRVTLAAVDRVVDGLGGEVDDVLVLGIGGSSLGARAIHQALTLPGGVPIAESERKAPRLHFPDNSDPWLLAALFERLDPRRTVAIAISKSGGTVETAAQLLVVQRWLGAELARSRIVLVTDPSKGPLRKLAQSEGIPSLEVPPNVGGRFSVLSAVGLLPARLAGLDVAAMLEGAARVSSACERPALRENPAGIIAVVHVLSHRLRGRSIHVMMPYADALRGFAAWFVQLWAESLGKRRDRRGRIIETGPTPLPAVGATDQHAQVQLFMEGPRDKIVTFIGVDHIGADLDVPKSTGEFGYLGGTTLGTILDAERRGTSLALARDGRPSITLKIPKIDAAALGGLFFLYEAATAFAGDLYGIDAFDQPGVEEGKRLAFGVLGRQGFEAAANEVREAETARPSRYRIG